jgi:hypothetical protein
MKLVRPAVWIALGIVIGLLSSGAIGAFQVQQPKASRIQKLPAGVVGKTTLFFLHDPKDDGCWLVTEGSAENITALAAAPRESCY